MVGAWAAGSAGAVGEPGVGVTASAEEGAAGEVVLTRLERVVGFSQVLRVPEVGDVESRACLRVGIVMVVGGSED